MLIAYNEVLGLSGFPPQKMLLRKLSALSSAMLHSVQIPTVQTHIVQQVELKVMSVMIRIGGLGGGRGGGGGEQKIFENKKGDGFWKLS